MTARQTRRDWAERCQLTVTIEDAAGAAVDVALPLLAALQETVRSLAHLRGDALPGVDAAQAADAVSLRVVGWNATTVSLMGPDLPLPTRVADPDSGITLLEVALGDLLDGLAEGSEPALAPLAELLARRPLAMTVAFSPVVGEDREVRIEQHDAARLT